MSLHNAFVSPSTDSYPITVSNHLILHERTCIVLVHMKSTDSQEIGTDRGREADRVTRAAGVVGVATLISRILGFARDMVIAFFFGTGASADAFFVAFRLPNLLRRLFAEGAFTVAFVPVFTQTMSREGKSYALETARAVLTALGVILAVLSVAGVLFAPAMVRVIAPGFTEDPAKLNQTIELTRIVFPYIFFIGLVAGCMGVLNSLQHFAAPALAPALLNLSMILAMVFFASRFQEPVYALAWGVMVGGIAQLLFQAPFMKRQGFSLRPSFRFRNPALKQILFLMTPAALGAAVYQINILVGTLLASLLPSGSVSYLYYADRVVQFPLGIFAIALGTASLPSLSRFAAQRDMDGLVDTFSHALRLTLFVAVPSTLGLILLREPIVGVLFQRGAFGGAAAAQTASALLYYSMGLWASSALRVVLSGFYALQDTKTPVKVAVLSLGANIAFSIVLMQFMAHNGLALATTLSSILNFSFLLFLLRSKTSRLDGRTIGRSLAKTLSASAAMLIPVSLLARIPLPGGGPGRLFLTMASALIVFLGASYALRSPELGLMLRSLRRVREARSPSEA